MEYLLNTQISTFLKDYEKNSSTLILEEGKEKDELIESAKKRGILISKNDVDLGVLKTIYCFTDTKNDNNCVVPTEELVPVLSKIIGRPMNRNHNRKEILGFYTDYKYIAKEKKVITYAVFFKSSQPELWQYAQEAQKKGKLSSSFELWSPKEKRVYREDGSFELHDITPAGGALIFEEDGELPAFKDAKVLAIAKKEISESIDEKYLTIASKYKCSDIIINGEKHCENCGKCKIESAQLEQPKVEELPIVKKDTKIKCSNCGVDFENRNIGDIKCPNCFSILDKEGKVLYPAQIIDFKVQCPSCKTNNWRILNRDNENLSAKLKCLHCAQDYDVEFDQPKNNELINKINFVCIGSVSCYQCGSYIDYSGISKTKERILKCPKCGIEFPYNIEESNSTKKIKRIQKPQGGNKMPIELSKFHRYIEDADVYDKSVYEDYVVSMQEAKKLTYEERKGLSDKDFAVVVRVKNKKTGEPRKIRMFPIQDIEHCRSALSRIAQEAPQKTLKDLGVSVEKTKAKIVKKAKEFGIEVTEKASVQPEVVQPEIVVTEPVVETKVEMAVEAPVVEAKAESVVAEVVIEAKVEEVKTVETVVEKPVEEVVPISDSVIEAKAESVAEVSKIVEEVKIVEPFVDANKTIVEAVVEVQKEEAKTVVDKTPELQKRIEILTVSLKKVGAMVIDLKGKVEFHKANAIKIVERRNKLGETSLTDEDLLDDTKFEKAGLEKENLLLKASLEKSVKETVGEKTRDNDYYKSIRDEVDQKAFPMKSKDKKSTKR